MNEDIEAALVIIAVLLLVIAFFTGVAWMVHKADESGSKICEKICEKKGYEFLDWVGGMKDCKCLDDGGDIIYLSTT